MNDDLIDKIIKNNFLLNFIIEFNDYLIEEYLNLRLVCKNFNESIYLFIKKPYDPSDSTYYQRTFFMATKCMSCQKIMSPEEGKSIYYYQDYYPRRISIYCNNYKCYIRTLKTWANSSFINQQVIFLKNKLNCSEKYYIPRSDGSKTYAYIEDKYLILFEDEIYFHFSFNVNRNNYTKICLLKNLIECNPNEKTELINISGQINENNIVPFYDQINHNKIKELLPLNFD